MTKRFSNKVAIITGAGQGIGKGLALRFAREGADVVIAEYNADSARAVASEIEALGVRAMPYPIDVSDPAAAKQMVRDVVQAFGHIDILINNAGVLRTLPMLELSEAQWDRTIAVNQKGMFFMSQAVAEQMIAQTPDVLRQGAGLADVVAAELAGDQGPTEEELATLAGSYGKIVNFTSIAGRRGRPLGRRLRRIQGRGDQHHPIDGAWPWLPIASMSTLLLPASSLRRCGSKSTEIGAGCSAQKRGRPSRHSSIRSR